MSQSRRLRIFAGPNGSGKSTIIHIVKDAGIDLGTYVNADDINKELIDNKEFDFNKLRLSVCKTELKEALQVSSLFTSEQKETINNSLALDNNRLFFSAYDHFDYLSTFLADFIRNKLLDGNQKFTFESVMSHPSKIEFIERAHQAGYKTYLYFVTLEDPELNKARVRSRVLLDGHDVPPEKIETRYFRTMHLLYDAVRHVDKAFFFDNSSQSPILFASYENGEITIDDPEQVPQWFHKYLLDKISGIH